MQSIEMITREDIFLTLNSAVRPEANLGMRNTSSEVSALAEVCMSLMNAMGFLEENEIKAGFLMLDKRLSQADSRLSLRDRLFNQDLFQKVKSYVKNAKEEFVLEDLPTTKEMYLFEAMEECFSPDSPNPLRQRALSPSTGRSKEDMRFISRVGDLIYSSTDSLDE